MDALRERYVEHAERFVASRLRAEVERHVTKTEPERTAEGGSKKIDELKLDLANATTVCLRLSVWRST